MVIGNVVQLKSGGPQMTVNLILQNGSIRCVFFQPNNGGYMTEDFQPEALKILK